MSECCLICNTPRLHRLAGIVPLFIIFMEGCLGMKLNYIYTGNCSVVMRVNMCTLHCNSGLLSSSLQPMDCSSKEWFCSSCIATTSSNL